MKNTDKATDTVVATKPDAKFPLATLRKDCVKLFGITSSTFDGAIYGKDGEYTIAEAKRIIEDWKKGVVSR